MDKSSNIHPKTDEIFVSVETPPPEEQNQPNSQETIRFIDVHIYDNVPSGEIEPDQATIIDEDSQDDTTPVQPRSYTRNIIMLLAGVMLIAAIVIALLLPILVTPPPINITIIPVTKQIDMVQSITVASRKLPTLTMSQQKTVPTSGYGHSDAKQASGYVTFFNSALYPQTIEAGTLLTSSSGVQVVTDQAAYIPASNLATNGQAIILAHAVIPGPSGNIAASTIYGPCCRENIMVANTAFSGGQVARNYRMVTQQDINTAVADLKSSLQASSQAAFQQQVQSDDTLLPLTCNLSSKPDHAVGTEAKEVTITVNTTCTGFTYNTPSLQQQVTQIVNQEATKFGNNYSLSGTISSNVIQATPKGNSIVLQVRMTANYSYHFTDQEQRGMVNSIAGKNRNTAINLLLAYAGVQSVSVSSGILPTDVQNIRLLVIYEQ